MYTYSMYGIHFYVTSRVTPEQAWVTLTQCTAWSRIQRKYGFHQGPIQKNSRLSIVFVCYLFKIQCWWQIKVSIKTDFRKKLFFGIFWDLKVSKNCYFSPKLVSYTKWPMIICSLMKNQKCQKLVLVGVSKFRPFHTKNPLKNGRTLSENTVLMYL